jgi:lipoprotein-releasing system permease protein
MGDIRVLVGPFLQLLFLIVLAIAVVSALVIVTLFLLKTLLPQRVVASPTWFVALRFLLGYRGEGRIRGFIPVSHQNFIAMVGTAIGTWALVVVLSVMAGFEADLKNKIVWFSPHFTVKADESTLDGRFDPNKVATLLGSLDGVEVCEPFVHGEVMLTSSSNMAPGTNLYGVEPSGGLFRQWFLRLGKEGLKRVMKAPVLLLPDREMGFGARGEEAREDDTLSPKGKPPLKVLPPVILGFELAQSLAVEEGDEVSVVVPNGDIGPTGVRPRVKRFRVAGIIATGLYDYDLRTAYTTLGAAKDLFYLETPNQVGGMVREISMLGNVVTQIEKVQKDLGIVEISTVTDTHGSLFSALKVEKIAMFLVLGLVVLVAAFNVFGSLLLVTMERGRDIAVLRGMGATSKEVGAIFVSIGSLVGLVGGAAGIILGLLVCMYVRFSGIELPSQYYLRTLPVEIRWGEVLLTYAAALLCVVVASLYPALIAGRILPAQGLRND